MTDISTGTRPGRFPELVPMVRPTVEADAEMELAIKEILQSGMLTNGRHVREFEEAACAYLGVGHAVAVSNCTTGLMLVFRCLELTGDIVVPSFTFMASGHAIGWSGNRVRFADADPRTWTLDPHAVAPLVQDAAGVLAVHTFGVPCDTGSLQELCDSRGIPLVIDAAHGFGSRYPDGTMVGGKGVAEVFSLSPTKTLSTGEGGLITTNDAALAARLRTARDYGNPGDYDSRFFGLNGRMTEVSGFMGVHALNRFSHWLGIRRSLAERYRSRLDGLPGLSFQAIPEGAASSYKDLGILVDATRFGMTRDLLAERLGSENVSTRKYFSPALHQQTAYRDIPVVADLSVTEELAASMITLPLYSHMPARVVEEICDLIREIHATAQKAGGRAS
ncbi:DegT/DnrJ/EryC1/StrS family aminotransferase [Amycolatopsis decaplanina]|uniref:DegT/DnrJ/EryC1/StrS aminotransferase n=1 Tax=Amycolatopsis decaplanina DSM 44594 TaxID=1284240 RepID=M2X4C0_9PSEU|nr:DegT/DnrJ/EryC1/StrS family aminotransferase [Amycolatopsis decaplanina]EME55876.1 DegT/DnrJ/EryC1/StrS aminotransferase [Amycolatopsis decaplanina DSM 44594]